MNYLNEFDQFAADWLGNLIAAGHLPPATVDRRSITEVKADDLRDYDQCHFFSGIGGWPLALSLAGWDATRPVWTGSCPCQPYSAAGKGLGNADPRDLWPELFRLIRQCRPECVFGEQVEAAVRHGWLDRISTDLEAEGYTVGACVLGAHSVGAPHIRQRLYWVASRMADTSSREQRRARQPGTGAGSGELPTGGYSGHGGVADTGRIQCQRGPNEQRPDMSPEAERGQENADDQRRGTVGWMDDSAVQRHRRAERGSPQTGSGNARPSSLGQLPDGSSRSGGFGFWSGCDLVPYRDGKARRTQSGLLPLAHGIPNRVGLLRGYGNAIVPQVAAEFVRAFMDTMEETS